MKDVPSWAKKYIVIDERRNTYIGAFFISWGSRKTKLLLLGEDKYYYIIPSEKALLNFLCTYKMGGSLDEWLEKADG